jgi:hypothetical protein
MKLSLTVLACVAALSVGLARPVAAQESKAVQTMAGILLTENHFPSDAQKKTLTALAAEPTTTAHEKVLIQAILSMQHSVTAADKPKVQAVMKDASAPAGVKSIATVLDHFLHMPGDADKAILQKLSM